jgi:hypothetical protein
MHIDLDLSSHFSELRAQAKTASPAAAEVKE